MTQVPLDSQTGQLSPDGRWRWNGVAWTPEPVPSPAPVATPARPAVSQPGLVRPQPAATGGLGYQFGGTALWSIVFGLASVMVPLFTPIYFPILPIVGLWRGVLAVRSGRVVGGVIGLVINGIGCIVSLLASGLLFH